MAERPVWQTRLVSRQAAKDDDASTVSTRSTLSSKSEQEIGPQNLGLSPTAVDKGKGKAPDIRQEPQPTVFGSPDGTQVPFESNFIGLLIKLSIWDPIWRQEDMREFKWGSHRYRTRLSMQQMDAAKIGEGASFTVTKRHEFLVDQPTDTSKYIVMKDTKLKFDRAGKPSNQSIFASILAEIEILGHKPLYQHENIVTMLDIQWDHPSMYKEALGPTLYLEWANMGTLASYFCWYSDECNDTALVSRLLLDICRGLQALHACGITHGDIKPNNVLVFKEGDKMTAKLSDFGCSVIRRDDSDELVELTGFSPPWDAPEAGAKIRASLLHKTDIYSFGLVYWWARLGGMFPFDVADTEATGIPQTPTDSRIKRVENFKAKKSEELGPEMYASLLPSPESSSRVGLSEIEVTVIASATLAVDPEERDLDIVADTLLESITSVSPDKPPPEQPQQTFSEIEKLVWSSDRAWDIYMEAADFWRPIPRRFVDAMRLQVETPNLPQADRQALSILLLRCYLEGFGVDYDPKVSAHYWRKAAMAGNRTAQALAHAFHDALRVPLPSDIPIKAWLFEGMVNSYMMAGRKLARLDYALSQDAFPRRTSLDLFDSRFQTESKLITSLRGWSPTRTMSERFGPSNLSVVHFAAGNGWAEALNILLHPHDSYECRKYLNGMTVLGYTPLLIAFFSSQPEAARALLKNGADAGLSQMALLQAGIQVPGGLYGLLLSMPLDETGDIALASELCQLLKVNGADPNSEKMVGKDLVNLINMDLTFNQSVEQELNTAIELSIYTGDIGVVKCLLDIGATPTLLALHLAAGLHNVDAFRLMFEHPSCPFKTMSELDVGHRHILEMVLNNYGSKDIFSPLKRVLHSGKPLSDACRDMVQFLTTIQDFSPSGRPGSDDHTEKGPWWIILSKRGFTSFPPVLDLLLGPNHELLNTSSMDSTISSMSPPLENMLLLGNVDLALHLLSIGAEPVRNGPKSSLDRSIGFLTPDNETLCRRLLDAGCEPNAIETNTLSHSRGAQTPFQSAVLHQHFQTVSCLFEHGADRDFVTKSLGASKELTILGHLLYITWAESQNRIRYLFEAFPSSSPPEFIVMPHVGLSALQVAAQLTSQNSWGESDSRQVMEYLVSRYSSPQHLEYQRFDTSFERQQAGHGTGWEFAAVPLPIDRNNTTGSGSQQPQPLKFKTQNTTTRQRHEFAPSDIRIANGTALLMAVREVNLEAVHVLAEAGADVNAPMGYRVPSGLFSSASTSYATKKMKYAGTPMDFAILVREKMDEGEYPLSMYEKTPETKHYYRQRADEMVEYLRGWGGACSQAFMGERNKAELKRVRKEKGNRSAVRFLGSQIKGALALGLEVGRAEMREGREEMRRDREYAEERRRAREEGGGG